MNMNHILIAGKTFGNVLCIIVMASIMWMVINNGHFVTHLTALNQPPQAEPEMVEQMREITDITCNRWTEVFAVYETGVGTFEAACLRRNLTRNLVAERTGPYAGVEFYVNNTQETVCEFSACYVAPPPRPNMYCWGEGENEPTIAPTNEYINSQYIHVLRNPDSEGLSLTTTYDFGCPGRALPGISEVTRVEPGWVEY